MIKPFDKIKPVFNIDYEMNNLLRTIELKLNQISITDKQKRKYMISKSRVRSIKLWSLQNNVLKYYIGVRMKKYNVIVIFNKEINKTLMCKRTKEPYIGMYNLVGGKIEKENDGLNEAYRELVEETNISKNDVELKHFMNIEYVSFNKSLEVYYGTLNKEVELVEEVNKLEWVDINDNFFDMTKYAGEGNIGHIIEEIKIELNK